MSIWVLELVQKIMVGKKVQKKGHQRVNMFQSGMALLFCVILGKAFSTPRLFFKKNTCMASSDNFPF